MYTKQIENNTKYTKKNIIHIVERIKKTYK